MSIRAQTAPGVYTTVTDNSFIRDTTSRFHAGLIGPAEKGPFNVATPVRSMKEYQRLFGKSLTNSYLANAAAILSRFSDGTTIVRVGREYEKIAVDASGNSGSTTVFTASSAMFSANQYIRVSQVGKKTTSNTQISTVGSGQLVLSTGLADTYTAGVIEKSAVLNAANEAEAFLYATSWNAPQVGITISGDKNAFQFTMSGSGGNLSSARTALNAGNVIIKIVETNKATTFEARVKEARADNVVILETSNISKVGYQALPLQDSYTAATVQVKILMGTTPTIHLYAASAGTWANSDGLKTGLIVTVSPGSTPGTKKLNVYENSALVETVDSLSMDTSSSNYYETRINGLSNYISCKVVQPNGPPPANTIDAWDPAITDVNIAAFTGGFNGEDVTANEYIGTIDPSDESGTGLRIFEDSENLKVDVIWASPLRSNGIGQGTDIQVAQAVKEIAVKINALGLVDVPQGLTLREAGDWHNAAGLYSSTMVRLDTPRLACYWNWITITDDWTRTDKIVPPSIGALRAMAYTWDHTKPWYAPAGENQGVLDEVTDVEFKKVSLESRNLTYGNGNSINPIISYRGRFMVYGERTMQRAESKLTQVHNVFVTNYILNTLAEVARKFVFDPNDAELLVRLRLAFSNELDKVKADRGVEAYLLTMDNTNNTADNRNRNEVIADLSFIPTGTVERIFINATVLSSGIELNSVK
jgi:hypothetical protein